MRQRLRQGNALCVRRQRWAEMLGMLWFANTDGNHAQAGGFNFGLMPAQLGQPLTAE